MTKTEFKKTTFYVSSALLAVLVIIAVNFGWINTIIAKELPQIGAKNPPVQMDNTARALNNALVAASEAVTPTVVSIQVISEASGFQSFQGYDLEDFFRGWPFGGGNRDESDKFNRDRNTEKPKREGAGSGVIITTNGYIVTNNHVVEGAIENGITVRTADKKEYPATLVGTDPLTDLAVIKIEGENFPAAHLGNMDEVKPGEMVIAVGSPLRLQHTITQGIVSALGRGANDLGGIKNSYAIENYIQTDAAINPGNSGGGLFNLNGSLIGINTAIATQTGGFMGYGFAVPIDIVKATVKDLISSGKVRYGYIGAEIRDINSTEAKHFGLKTVEGVLVNNVQKNSAAEKADIQSEDIITAVNGKKTGTVAELKGTLSTYRAGDEVEITIWRNKKQLTKKVKLQPSKEDEEEDMAADNKKDGDEYVDEKSNSLVEFEKLGFTIEPLQQKDKDNLDIENGVYVKNVKRYSPAYDAGIRPQSIIVKADRKDIKTTGQLKKIINSKKSGETILLNLKIGKFNTISVLEIP